MRGDDSLDTFREKFTDRKYTTFKRSFILWDFSLRLKKLGKVLILKLVSNRVNPLILNIPIQTINHKPFKT